MLGDKTAVACLAVKDLQAAKNFYEQTLGLSQMQGSDEGGILYKTGSSQVFVYQSSFAGTNQATAVAFGVGDDLQKVIDDLKAKGVTFEHYQNIPNVKLEGDIHVSGDLRSAWFKDPDGNIINLINRM
jgi:catechol 2,3-dioxygenase-like lactoylglutathione lyase family enzyme